MVKTRKGRVFKLTEATLKVTLSPYEETMVERLRYGDKG